MSHTDTVTTIASRWMGAGGAFVFYREPGAVCCRGCYARNPEKVDDIGELAGKKVLCLPLSIRERGNLYGCYL